MPDKRKSELPNELFLYAMFLFIAIELFHSRELAVIVF